MVPLRKLFTPALAAVTLIAGLAAAPALADDSEQLELQVRKTLLDKLGTDAIRIEVRALDGMVLLGGTVKQRETQELAESVAKSVPGVTRVDNEIDLREYQRSTAGETATSETQRELSDAALHTKVRVALIDRMGSDGFRFDVDVAGGIVTLGIPRGYPNDRREQAISAVKSVSGVSKVVPLDATG